MCAGVIIERVHEGKCRLFVSKVSSTGKDPQLCSQARAVINKVYDYFALLKMHSGGCGLLERTSEATGTCK